MGVIDALIKARKKGIDNLYFEWVDKETVMVPTVDLLGALQRYTEQGRRQNPIWREEIKELQSDPEVEFNVIGHIVRGMYLSLDWRFHTEGVIYKALAEALLEQ